MEWTEYLPILMFVALALLLFSGFPVAFVLGGVGLAFAVLGDVLGELNWARMNILPSRMRADLVLEKAADHGVRRVRLRLK